MSSTDVRSDCKYTKDHMWARKAGAEVLVGITQFAANQLGDVVMVSIDSKPGTSVSQDDEIGTLESVKAVAAIFVPVSGEIVRLNDELDASPELVNEDPYEEGWIVALAPSNASELEGLLSPGDYTELLKGAESE